MNGETKEAKGHAHTWEAALIDQEIYGKTNNLEGHSHQISLPTEHCFAEGSTLKTSVVDGHSHEVDIPRDLLERLRPDRPPRRERPNRLPIEMKKDEDEKTCNSASLKDDEEDDVYGPDGASDDDDVKTAKKAVDEDGLPVIPKKRNRDFQGGFTKDKWDGSKGRFSLEQLQRAVPASMRAWGKAQGDGTSKSNYKLPYKEPSGTINVNGVRNALARAKSVKGPPTAAINSAIGELQRVLVRAKKAGFSAKEEYQMVVKVLETFEDGNPKIEQLEGDRVLIRDQKIFKVGLWNDVDITEEDIISMANNYVMLQVSFEPPIKIGHDVAEHKKLMSECSAGWVTNVRAELPWLKGDFDVPMDVYKDYLRTKKLRFKSIEMHPNFVRDGKEYGPVLTGLALLGINNPAVNDLGPVALPFSCNKEEFIRVIFDDGGEEDVEESTKKFQDEIATLKKEKAEQAKKFEAMQKKADENAKVATALAARLRTNDAQNFADKLKAEGKLLPKDESIFVQFMLTLDESKTLTFSQEDGSEKKLSQTEMFKEIAQSYKPQVDLDKQIEDAEKKKPNVPEPKGAEDEATDSDTPKMPNFGEHSAAFARVIDELDLKVYGADLEPRARKIMAENEGWTFEQAMSVVYAQEEEKK